MVILCKYRKYNDFRFFCVTFLGSQKTKNQKCLMGLFDTSKDIVICSNIEGRHMKILYHISDMIPVALPPRVSGDGLTRSLFILCIVQYIMYTIWLV